MAYFSFKLLVLFALACSAAPTPTGPTVTLDFGTFVGVSNPTTGTDAFYGFPFAAPPTGTNRLRTPQPFTTNYGSVVQNATAPKSDCSTPNVQVALYSPSNYTGPSITDAENVAAGGSEDCLYLNVFRPSTATAGSKLPVMYWFYGGAWIDGGASPWDGSYLVAHSIAMQEPIIHVVGNYRLSGWGWLPGLEMQEAGLGNLGLLDQRAALLWVQKYIGQFGGDPTKVTIFGESAGSVSIGFQLVMYGGLTENTFRAGIMESGSPMPVATMADGEAVFNEVVSLAGCASASDKIECLRGIDYETFSNAVAAPIVNQVQYRVLTCAYMPRVDYLTVPDYPQNLLLEGRFAHVPIISGDNGDEGTIFAVTSLNVTTDSEVAAYFEGMYVDLSPSTLQELLQQYPDDPAAGSPYNTGEQYAITPEYKRMASIVGDVFFVAMRRFLSYIYVDDDVPVWSYLFDTTAGTPWFGAEHSSEITFVYAVEPGLIGEQMPTLWIAFANYLDPNQYGAYGANLTIPYWPQYGTNWTQIHFLADSSALVEDNYRIAATNIVVDNIAQFILA